MSGLLPLIFALVIAETSATAAPLLVHGTHAWWWWPVVVITSLLGWFAICETTARLVARRHSWTAQLRADLVIQAGVLGWFAWLCYGLGWSHLTNAFVVALAPWLAAQIIHWWCQTVGVRALTGHPWSRGARVMHQLRFGVLPVLLILPWFDLGAWLAVKLDIMGWFNGSTGTVLAGIMAQGFLLLVLVVLPLPLMWLWGAKPLRTGPLADEVRHRCQQMGVRISGLLRWPVPGGKVYNAAVIGMIPRLRFVLFTEDLVRDLPPDQLTAVLGHELGHARHGHLWLYFLFATLSVLAIGLLQLDVAILIRPLFDAPPAGVMPLEAMDPWGGMTMGIAALLLLAVQWRLVFGVISRACERQADLAGAALAGDPQVMAAALKSVARLAGQPEDAPSWRHHSIAQRVAFLEQVSAVPRLADLHHQIVARMRNILIAMSVAVAAALLVLSVHPTGAPARDGALAGKALAAWVETDPDLGAALDRADRESDPRPLASWLNRADDLERQRLAEILMGVTGDDTRTAYRLRHRLRAFLAVGTGDPGQELELDNLIAYALVAGTDHPTPQDLAIARERLPALEERTRLVPDAAFEDTLGCVRFALGEWPAAVLHFTHAVELEAKTKVPATPIRDLYQRRLKAAQANAAAGTALQPLPKDWSGPAETAPSPATPPTTPRPAPTAAANTL